MAITVIRHTERKSGNHISVAMVITAYISDGAVFHMYTQHDNGTMTLDIEESYSTESLAIERFNEVVV